MLTLDDIKFFSDQIYQFKEGFDLCYKELKRLGEVLEDSDDSKFDRYEEIIKPNRFNILFIEIESIGYPKSIIIPKFKSSYKVSSKFSSFKVPYHINIESYHKHNDNRRLQLEIYFNDKKEKDNQDLLTESGINKVREQIPEKLYEALNVKPLLGKLFNTKFENLPPLGIYHLAMNNLAFLERKYLKRKGLSINDALRNRKIVKKFNLKYKKRYNKYALVFNEIEELKKKLYKQQTTMLTPFKITFQWWDLEGMKLAFPSGRNKTGIKYVKNALKLNYPNLILFNEWEELYLQFGIYAIRAKVLEKKYEDEFIEDFYKYYSKRKFIEEDIFQSGDVAYNIIQNYSQPYELSHFWSYVGSICKLSRPKYHKPVIYPQSDNNVEKTLSNENAQKLKEVDIKAVQEISEELHIPKATIYSWLRRGKIINAKIVDGSSTKKLESKWEINFNAYQEIIDLNNKSKKIIDWDIPYFQDLLSSYISEHPCCNEESAKRNLRRLIKKARNNNEKAKKKLEYLVSKSAVSENAS